MNNQRRRKNRSRPSTTKVRIALPLTPLTIVAFTLSTLVFATAIFDSVWFIIKGPMPEWGSYTLPVVCYGPVITGGLAMMASIQHFTADIRPRGTWMVVCALFFSITTLPLLLISIALAA